MTSKTDIPDIPYKRSTQTRSETLSEGALYDSSSYISKHASHLVDRCRKCHLDPVRTPAVIFGMAGSVLVAMPTTFLRSAGFAVWILGNTLWVLHGRRVSDRYIIVLFGFYLATAVLGLVNCGGV